MCKLSAITSSMAQELAAFMLEIVKKRIAQK